MIPPQPHFDIANLPTHEAFTKIDAEILRCKVYISTLNSLRNNLAPISKLPVEVLAMIFTHAHEDDLIKRRESFEGDLSRPMEGSLNAIWPRSTPPLRRLVISWVSRHWRDVAIRSMPLWTLITNDFSPQTYLARCGQAELSIDFFFPSPSTLSAVRMNIHRVRSLKLDEVHVHQSEGVPPFVNDTALWLQHAPLLEDLDLRSISCFDFEPFSGINHPKLKRLRLGNALYSWTQPHQPSLNLTVLIIESPQERVSIDLFLDILQGLPNLIDCYLRNIFLDPVEGITLSKEPQSLPLPNLKTFTSNGGNGAVFDLFKYLDVPQALLHVFVPFRSLMSNEGDFEVALQRLDQYRKISNLPIHHMELQSHDDVFSCLVATSSEMKNRVLVELHRDDINDDPIDGAAYVLSSITLDNLESLWANSLSQSTILMTIPSLRVVTVSSHAVDEFLSMLCHPRRLNTYLKEGNIPFPGLEDLTFDTIPKGSVNSLVNALRVRTKTSGLQKLTLSREDHGLVEDDWGHLEAVVKVVSIDTSQI
ncbi:hypothetical protein BDN72DRAFT_840428 [Pluteus cervinus]|uniref:Uncharacterized protein n=1 Tax=Pluteus cervinus TaxID=181527 RepID=A0ACD3AWJ1_9AGAR|nr:hypothetical protein BDN72DRAFT_840428 [Pluteus cervinus]